MVTYKKIIMELKKQEIKSSAKSQMLHFYLKYIIRKLKQNPKANFNINTYPTLVSILGGYLEYSTPPISS